MSSTATHENITRILTTFNIEIDSLPDGLKCGKCNYVLKDAYQLPCGCRLCRTCIDDLMAMAVQFCPGGLHECSGTPLSTDHRDFSANKSISRLTAKCPLSGCSHKCQLVDMDGHLRVCARKTVDCPFREFSCRQDKLTAEEMCGHLQQDSLRHSEMLIAMVTSINRDMELLKGELMLKGEQVKHLENEIRSIKVENKSIKDENKSIRDDSISMKREKEILSGRVRQLSERLEREINERRESDERSSASLNAITGAIESNWGALGAEMEPVKEDIRSIKCDIDSLKVIVKSIQEAAELERGDSNCDEWLIDVDMSMTDWGFLHVQKEKTSATFRAATCPHTYQLASWNNVSMGTLWIWLLIWAGQRDSLLKWPFRVTVTITIAHMDKPGDCCRLTRQCQIERPADSQYSRSNEFIFEHLALRDAGLDLRRGVRVSCQIMPGGD